VSPWIHVDNQTVPHPPCTSKDRDALAIDSTEMGHPPAPACKTKPDAALSRNTTLGSICRRPHGAFWKRFITVVMACPNGSIPLLLPWTNNSVSAVAGAISSRGVSFAIGTPPQPFSLTPSTFLNNLFVNNAAECVATTNRSCIGQLGGIYDSASSTSFTKKDYAVWEGSRDLVDLAAESSTIYVNDAVAFGMKPKANTFSSYPFYTNGSKDGKRMHSHGNPSLTFQSIGRSIRQRQSRVSSDASLGPELDVSESPC